MQHELVAYAEDCIIRGTLDLDGPRLTDHLADVGVLRVGSATLEALDDGRIVDAGDLDVALVDLCAVTSAGSRGSKTRRIRTRQHPIVAALGPYRIVGYVHAAPTADPIVVARRRLAIPLTEASIVIEATRRILGLYDVLILNRDRIEWVESATDGDLALADPFELRIPVDPRAKDRTGELFSH